MKNTITKISAFLLSFVVQYLMSMAIDVFDLLGRLFNWCMAGFHKRWRLPAA
ncbi:hypothetical protein HOC54_00120 [Candidatus Peregrinibacteria bacterium]|jgi:hypothetical protein|nr:hypothetical protein [Candidatus Peregrinibacteria bacterium]